MSELIPDQSPHDVTDQSSPLLCQLEAALSSQLQSYAIQKVVLGLSGGLDSMLLLQLLVRWQARAPARQLQAVHVHHGLSKNADCWAEFCQQQCTSLGVPLLIRHVHIDTAGNIEAQARTLRYQVLTAQLSEASHSALLTAHHADDQLETLLLALKRGSGPAGLAGIASAKPCTGGWLLRPLLHFEREHLESAANTLQLTWIDDESNQDTRFDRNFLRLEVLPLLKQRWGQFAQTAGRSMQQLAQVQQVNDELLQQQLSQLVVDDQLSIAGLLQQGEQTQSLLLRLWLKKFGLNPSTARLKRIQQELIHAKADAEPQIKLAGCSIRRFAGQLYVLNHEAHTAITAEAPCLQPLRPGKILTLADGRDLVWQTHRADFGDTASYWPLAVGMDEVLQLGFGWLNYRFNPAGYPHSKPLKQWCKLWKVPPWQRGSMPSIVAGQQILLVIDRFAACTAADALSWVSVRPQSKRG
jgi:tRNA(Ile)-lysidine synthase